MREAVKTKKELIRELEKTHQHLTALEVSEAERKRAEEALRESEEKYRTLVEDALIGIMHVDMTGKITYVNRTILQDTGYSQEDLLGKNAFRLGLISSDTAKVLIKRMKEKLMGQPPGLLEMQYRRKDGEWIWLQIRGKVLKKHNTPVGIQIIGEDITEHKRAEEALKLRAQILDGATDSIFLHDFAGNFIYVNETACRTHGYSREEFMKMNISRIITPERIQGFDSDFQEILEKGQVIFESTHLRKDGSTMPVEVHGRTIESGGVKLILTVNRDITERKRAEEALQTILKTALDGFWRTDLEGRLLEVNDSYCKMIGYTREELLNMSGHDVEAIESPEEVAQRIKKIAKQGSDRFETRHKRKDGRIIDVEMSVNYLDVGEGQCFVFARDITERKRAEEALGESEEKYRSLVQGFADGIAIVQGLEVRFVNDRLLQMLGYQRENEIVGHPFTKFISSSYRSLMAERGLAREAGDNVPNYYEFKALRKDGTEFDAEIYITLIRFQGVTARQGIIRDITERKRAEEALRESEREYRDLAESISDIFFAFDKDLHYTYWNKASEKLTGISAKDALGKQLYDIFPDIEATRKAERAYLKALKTKQPQHFINEYHLEGKDYYFEVSAYPTENSLSVFVKDITERKRAEAAVQESEEKYSKAFHAIPDSIGITTLGDGIFIEINDSFTRINGYTREEVIGRSSTELGLWVNPEERNEAVKILKEKGRVSNREFDFRIKSGEIRTWMYSAELINLGGEPCVLTITTDITERKQAEEKAREAETLRELNELRTELLANISHELRTPLTSIKGYATMLLDYERRLKRLEKRGYLQTIDKNTNRLAELIEQLLEMSRLEAGMLKINKKPATINKLCWEAIAEARVRSPNHRFTLDLPKKLPKVNIDARRIRQVLDNLISNAIQYSQPGTEVAIAARQVGHELLVSVTDQGIGIPQRDLPRVFERMFRSQQRLILEAGGAGLGLTICKGLVEAHNGRIWIESEEGKETRSFFTLPIYTESGNNHGQKD
jgi:PAS domain S-box-containing protein